MLEIEVIGIDRIAAGAERAVGLVVPTAAELERLCALAIASSGIEDGHVAIEFVDAERIQALNREHRRLDEPTDVLSFGVRRRWRQRRPRRAGRHRDLSGAHGRPARSGASTARCT